MSDQLVVARFVGTEDAPRFTRTCTIEELLAEVLAKIPVDEIYLQQAHPDGRGYSYRRVGRVMLDIQTEVEVSSPPAPQLPISQSPPERRARTTLNDTPPLTEASEAPQVTYQFNQVDEGQMELDFSFAQPRSQAELLKERGLEQAPRKNRKPLKSKSLPDDDLPNSVSHGSKMKVTGIRAATQAEANKASQFGKS